MTRHRGLSINACVGKKWPKNLTETGKKNGSFLDHIDYNHKTYLVFWLEEQNYFSCQITNTCENMGS